MTAEFCTTFVCDCCCAAYMRYSCTALFFLYAISSVIISIVLIKQAKSCKKCFKKKKEKVDFLSESQTTLFSLRASEKENEGDITTTFNDQIEIMEEQDLKDRLILSKQVSEQYSSKRTSEIESSEPEHHLKWIG